MLGLGGHPHLPELDIQLPHVGGNPILDRPEILVLQLLALGGRGTVEGAAAAHQIKALVEKLLVEQEVLLLGSHRGDHFAGGGVAQSLEDPQGLLGDRVHRTEQRGFLVQGFAVVRAEGGGDAEGDVAASVLLQKGGRGAVPGRVAPGLEGDPQPAAGKG